MWPRWLQWIERLIMIQAFCSIIPTHVLGRPEAGYWYWMYVSLVLIAGVTIRRIVSLERLRRDRDARLRDRDPDPTHLE